MSLLLLFGAGALGPYGEAVFDDGAVHYWRLGELTGTTAADSAGGVDGLVAGGVTFDQTGVVANNRAMAFNGTSGVITTEDVVTVLTPFTVEVWVKPSGTAAMEILSTRAGSPAIDDLRLGVQLSNGRVLVTLDYAGGSSPQQNLAPARVINDGQWHHVAVVVTALACDVYIDGLLAEGFILPASYTGAAAVASFGFDAFGGYGTGSLDEIAIYDTALSAGTIADHYDLADLGAETLAAGDLSTAFAKWLATILAPKNEVMRATLTSAYSISGATDLTTVVRRFLNTRSAP